ncbi:MAG: LruC domain-containing protein [Sphingobacteriaceae bacterium]|nr:LruC domain-containing protein [Sphingobacteriaceae bacterium]
MKHCIIILLSFCVVAVSCNKDFGEKKDQNKNGSGKIAPDGFNFETAKKINVSIRLLSNINEPLKGIIVNINTTSGETLLRGVSDINGFFKGVVTIPAYIDTLLINPDNTGLVQNVKGLIQNNSLNCVLGGTEGASGNIALSGKDSKIFGGRNINSIFANTVYSNMGQFDQFGRPTNYLVLPKGTVSADLLTYLAESLPDQQDVRVHHPQYLSDNATEHLNIVKTSDVWITFVSEGAGYTNAVGYYTYPTNSPPNQVHKIDTVKMIFPNTSGAGSGGNMQSGDRVKIGRFAAGTSVGFVLFQNGWKQNLTTVNTSGTKFYSDSKFNPESSDALKTHTVLLNFAKENLFVIGFEDIKRDDAACDQDFNDLILYATSNPVDGISTTGVEGISAPKDTDGDGVWDANDKFPTDATRAYITYFPSATTKGTLVFEDNWPSKGDYDMNDLVVNYRYSYISNASNKVVEMSASFQATAAWAQNKNGFGVQLPFAPNIVSSVTGYKLSENYITLNPNGTEAGQSNVVIIPFDNHTKLVTDQTTIIDSAVLKITFTSPVDLSTVGTGPYNPFLISNGIRGAEAHLAGQRPTDKADPFLFGTAHDKTNLANNVFYLSEENWPWALSFTEVFRYPIEGNAITSAYLHFSEWASSGGTLFPDWYKNTAAGYRDPLKIR